MRRTNKDDISGLLLRYEMGFNIRDPHGDIDEIIGDCVNYIRALRELSEDLCLVMPREPGCGDYSREERTRADATRLLGYEWRK